MKSQNSKFLINKNGYFFEVRNNVIIDEAMLILNNTKIFEDIDSMYAELFESNNLHIDEVEGCEYIIDNGYMIDNFCSPKIKIDEDVNNFIINYEL